MAENEKQVEEYSLEDLEKLLGVSEVAEMFDVRPGTVRRAARKGEIPGAVEILGRHGFDPELVVQWEPQEGSGRKAPRRDDGRQRYTIYLTVDEATDLGEKGYELIDPRERSRKRRQERKAKKAAAKVENEPETSEDESNPFDSFGE